MQLLAHAGGLESPGLLLVRHQLREKDIPRRLVRVPVEAIPLQQLDALRNLLGPDFRAGI